MEGSFEKTGDEAEHLQIHRRRRICELIRRRIICLTPPLRRMTKPSQRGVVDLFQMRRRRRI